MRKRVLAGTGVAAVFAVGFIATPLAHADEAGFLNELHNNKFPGWSVGGQQMPDGVLVAQGYMACNRLHLGEKPDQTLAVVNPGDVEVARALIHAAQHNLCPDTL